MVVVVVGTFPLNTVGSGLEEDVGPIVNHSSTSVVIGVSDSLDSRLVWLSDHQAPLELTRFCHRA